MSAHDLTPEAFYRKRAHELGHQLLLIEGLALAPADGWPPGAAEKTLEKIRKKIHGLNLASYWDPDKSAAA